ncbi:MAG: cyanase [Sporocytophaga sp.]|uniref:cyanase n=1 Tax=Sporocytophaga sp. TaxID=2231183 RepID=UPI001B16A228|nr:cyanase [Sporocytophaga sp.]MBO9702875.1 cyanase [Sporocytophaga sp.]
MITKIEMTEAIIAAKAKKNTTWTEISKCIGLSEIFTTSACLGQNTLSKTEAEQLGSYLELSPDVVKTLQVFPSKGPGQEISTDPLIYRFFEICFVYGPTLKEVIQEKMGDGIMSAIDFTMNVDKVEDPKGDRVIVTMNGKFLPYKKW